jgi:hypothetical protein
MKRILMLAFAAALTMGASACQDTTNPSSVLSGTYTLRSINGQTPPVTVDATTEITGGYIRIDRDGTYSDVLTYRDLSSGISTDETINGTWALSGNTVEFTDFNDPYNPYYASVSNGQIVFTNNSGGYQYTTVYAK